MRGKGFCFLWCAMGNRITPAYAGKRNRQKNGNQLCKDHPRLCGEKYQIGAFFASPLGSPPPMRGKGKTLTSTENLKKDHPRLCGEKRSFFDLCCHCHGSPPPMRGKVDRCFGLVYNVRITPAYAGKSFRILRQAGEVEDHPRLCGEKQLIQLQHLPSMGSPPPMRGKVSTSILSPDTYGDHPRLCGEKSWQSFVPAVMLGSPPPMRGKVCKHVVTSYSRRITPAYAGKSCG